MKIAIIGASGFVGNRLVEHLHLGGLHQVVPIVRQPGRLALPARFNVDWRIADALDVNQLTTALAGCDAVVHAAIGNPRQIEAMPAVLTAAAAAAKISRVVYLSTASVHGQAPSANTNEDAPLHTHHTLDYNNAKVRAEKNFFVTARKHSLEAFALRPGIVYGPRSRWITDTAADLRAGSAWLFHDGTGICNSIYVDNLIAAVLAALTAPAENAGAYLVGDAETVTWHDFYFRIAKDIGSDVAAIASVKQLPTFKRSAYASFQRALTKPSAQRLLPFFPRRMKSSVKRLLQCMNAPRTSTPWRLPEPVTPRITEELALLQQCSWKFPHDRAASRLGYRPAVSFSEGLNRSLAWLAFAEGRT
jgi:nucleoside-diphosphate-sugar epimerase